MRAKAIIIGAIFIGLLTGVALAAPETGIPAGDADAVGRTPPRLSYLDGQVSFWRPGADDWVQAKVNTALAPGDQLYVQGAGNFELQVGSQAFVRAGDDAQIGLETQEPDFLRFKVTSGRAAFDLRSLGPGRTVEVDTPHAAFTIEHEGYYRLDVEDTQTTFTARRTGRATAVAAGGEAVPVEPGEALVIQGPSEQNLAFQAAPGLDDWDNWNYARTEDLLAARSQRYMSPDTYGAADLDRYGSWRVLPTYGSVWVPSGVTPGWAPYSTGSWMYDPYYGWTWVDTAPWGWAPYHYGRWVYVNSYWCWAPGPVVTRTYYAPALVAFFGGPAVSVGISIGGPGVGWVALGWGEPLIPWWGRTGFIHRPWWGGWGGPRCINNRVIHHRTVVTVNDIHSYNNSRIRHAMVVVDKDHFGHGRIRRDQRRYTDAKHWRPLHRAPDIRPDAHSYAPSTRGGVRPPEKNLKRSVVTYDRHNRVKTVSIKEADRGFRPAVRAIQEHRRPNSQGQSYIRNPPRIIRPAPATAPPVPVHKAPKAAGRDRWENPDRRFDRVPTLNRSTQRHMKRSVPEAGPGVASGHRQSLPEAPGYENRTRHPSNSADVPSRSQRFRPQSGRRVQTSNSGSTAVVPGFNGGRQPDRKPLTPAPTVQVPQRQPPPARIVPNPGTDRRFEPSRRTVRDEQGFSGNSNSEQYQRPERHGRPEMNRGADSNSRGGFQRRFRN